MFKVNNKNTRRRHKAALRTNRFHCRHHFRYGSKNSSENTSGFHSCMISVFVILTKYLLEIFPTSYLSRLPALLLKKRFAKLRKVFLFNFIVSGDTNFSEVFLCFSMQLQTKIFLFLYAFRSSLFPLLFALFLSLDLETIFFLIRDVMCGLLFPRTIGFLKGATVIFHKLF